MEEKRSRGFTNRGRGGAPLRACDRVSLNDVAWGNSADSSREVRGLPRGYSLYGAPFSLTSFPDLFEDAWNSTTERVYQAANREIQNGTMPPPGQPMLSDAEKAAFQDWVSHCAPEGDPSEAEEWLPQDKPQVPPAPEGLEIVEVDANEYPVPRIRSVYMCFPFVLICRGIGISPGLNSSWTRQPLSTIYGPVCRRGKGHRRRAVRVCKCR